jgi:hypothetical protein
MLLQLRSSKLKMTAERKRYVCFASLIYSCFHSVHIILCKLVYCIIVENCLPRFDIKTHSVKWNSCRFTYLSF